MLELLISPSVNSVTEVYFSGDFLFYHIIHGSSNSGNNVFMNPYIGSSCLVVLTCPTR